MDTAEALAEQGAQFQVTRQRAVEAGNTALRAVAAALSLGTRAHAEPALTELDFLFDVVAMADAASRLLERATPPREAPEPGATEFVVSSWFLADCAQYLLGHPKGYERLCLVTGSKQAHRRTLERMVKVALAESSLTCALAEELDLTRSLIAMDGRWGHALHGLFHSHPGQGSGATHPSEIDRDTHARYEAGGYPLVGGIFERSGFVRFFSHNRPFRITLFGKGVEQYAEDLFKISNLPHQAA